MSYLALDDLAKSFGDFNAVRGTNLEIREGEFLSLLGPSGCGKTTTLQMIAGFLAPSRGRVMLQGRDLTRMEPHRRGLGMVFQSYALFPHMTVAENVAFGLEMRRVPAAERSRRVAEVLEMVGLGAFGNRYPRQMSGGQQQRVALARAIVIRPPVLLLDEPLSNLDAKLREQMQGELLTIQRELGTTTVLVTHDQQEAMALSDRMVVMNHGVVEQVGAPEDLYGNPASDFVAQFLGRINLLPGQLSTGAEGPVLTIGDARWTLPPQQVAVQSAGPVAARIRPENLRLGAEGIPGVIARRTFQGAYWVCEITLPQTGKTGSGHSQTISVIHPNGGGPCPKQGESVRLAANASDLYVVEATA
ncbi:ABC transporter ATP-binding protein [Alloyangia pacifica]|uniref:ABC transporter ATP-binding protein n=1 Tax=Alloyangia pacifica TaxID=311180 RepID=UPI001CD7679D|nr:ABC transporter ATP-binding protein [Alloyangia pacifica]MCA0998001.1 ABC transporter ATP-binding protein [Alloyangia pacifica]